MFAIRENYKEFIQYYPATVFIVLLCSLASIVTMLFFDGYNEDAIIILGGLEKELINSGETWRFLTYAFGHMSLFHLLLNIPILLLISKPLERYFGSRLFFGAYILLSIASGIFIYYFYVGVYPLAGSSGAGCGLLGIFTFFLIRYPNKFNSYDKRFIIILLAISFIFTLNVPDISISGHVGGLISGFILGYFISIFKKDQKEGSFYSSRN